MRLIFFLLFFILVISINVNPISVVSDYLVNDTLELVAGTSKTYGVRLQNPEDYETRIKIDYDPTFMKIIDYIEVYTVPPKETHSVLFNVTAPNKPGLYTVSYTVSEVEPSAGGLGLLLKINRNFKLKAIKNPKKFYIDYDYVAYGTIILAFLLYLYSKKHYNGMKAKGKGTLRKNRKLNK